MASITTEQLKKYRFVWGRVRKALVEFGEFSPADAEAERKVIHRDALGQDKSSKDFTNADLNNVLDALDRILVLFDGPGSAPTRNAQNKIWAITQTGLPEPYLASISQDQFGTPDWRSLSEHQLARFRFTAVARAAAQRKAARPSTHPPASDLPF